MTYCDRIHIDDYTDIFIHGGVNHATMIISIDVMILLYSK